MAENNALVEELWNGIRAYAFAQHGLTGNSMARAKAQAEEPAAEARIERAIAALGAARVPAAEAPDSKIKRLRGVLIEATYALDDHICGDDDDGLCSVCEWLKQAARALRGAAQTAPHGDKS